MALSSRIHGKSVTIGEPQRHFLPCPGGISRSNHNILWHAVACSPQPVTITAVLSPPFSFWRCRTTDSAPSIHAGFTMEELSITIMVDGRDAARELNGANGVFQLSLGKHDRPVPSSWPSPPFVETVSTREDRNSLPNQTQQT